MAGKAGNNKQGNSNRSSRSGTREQTGGNVSISQPATLDPSANRDMGIATGKLKTEQDEKNFNLLVDDVPYFIKATSFSFNEEKRFYISVNDGTDHVFAWDSQVGRYRAIDDSASILPDALETEISGHLQSQHK